MANTTNKQTVFSTDETLGNIIYHTKRVRDKAKKYGKIFEESYRNLNAFATISNDLVLAYELLMYYYGDWWEKQHKKRLNKHDVEKVTLICKLVFLHAFDIVEYISKELLKRKKYKGFEKINDCFSEGGIVYFSDIIKQSRCKGLLSEQEKETWDNLRIIRNTLVHNNAFADRDGVLEHKFLDGAVRDRVFRFSYERDKPLTYNMNLGIILIEIMIELYYQWVQKIITLQ